jgi:HPt (histidine-containing phosphotransfer) domain-containing protein
MGTANEPEFDWSQAESLLGDDVQNVPQDMADIVLELVESAQQRFVELKAMNPDADRPAISALAHQLRGSLLNFGFVDVGERLFKIEKLPYESADYGKLVGEAEASFNASLKLLGGRYTTLRLS